eukprot:COSAG05_NODE_2112_length_3547_cov_1.596288_4_plen_83_part_00
MALNSAFVRTGRAASGGHTPVSLGFNVLLAYCSCGCNCAVIFRLGTLERDTESLSALSAGWFAGNGTLVRSYQMHVLLVTAC